MRKKGTSDKGSGTGHLKKVNKFKKLLEKVNLRRRFREWNLRRNLARAVNIMRKMNANMRKMGWERQRRRLFWRDFSKSPSLREEIFKEILNDN